SRRNIFSPFLETKKSLGIHTHILTKESAMVLSVTSLRLRTQPCLPCLKCSFRWMMGYSLKFSLSSSFEERNNIFHFLSQGTSSALRTTKTCPRKPCDE